MRSQLQDSPCAPLGAALWGHLPGREVEGSRVAGLACQGSARALVRGLETCALHAPRVGLWLVVPVAAVC